MKNFLYVAVLAATLIPVQFVQTVPVSTQMNPIFFGISEMTPKGKMLGSSMAAVLNKPSAVPRMLEAPNLLAAHRSEEKQISEQLWQAGMEIQRTKKTPSLLLVQDGLGTLASVSSDNKATILPTKPVERVKSRTTTLLPEKMSVTGCENLANTLYFFHNWKEDGEWKTGWLPGFLLDNSTGKCQWVSTKEYSTVGQYTLGPEAKAEGNPPLYKLRGGGWAFISGGRDASGNHRCPAGLYANICWEKGKRYAYVPAKDEEEGEEESKETMLATSELEVMGPFKPAGPIAEDELPLLNGEKETLFEAKPAPEEEEGFFRSAVNWCSDHKLTCGGVATAVVTAIAYFVFDGSDGGNGSPSGSGGEGVKRGGGDRPSDDGRIRPGDGHGLVISFVF